MEKVTLDSEQIKSEDGESELSKKRTIKIKNRLGNDKGGPNDSLLFDALEDGMDIFPGRVLLGDSGYESRLPWLCTPFPDNELDNVGIL